MTGNLGELGSLRSLDSGVLSYFGFFIVVGHDIRVCLDASSRSRRHSSAASRDIITRDPTRMRRGPSPTLIAL